MKKKVLAFIMAFVFCAAVMSAAAVQPALAQEMEAADYSAIAGFWENADNAGETLRITEDGLFVYINGDMDSQGYLEYVDEYEDGNGRYDMYNREGVWLGGIYQDSENSIHMGNDDGVVFIRAEEDGQWEDTQDSICVLTTDLEYADLVPLCDDPSWNGGYYYADMSEDGLKIIVNCCAEIQGYEDATSQEYREAFVAMVSGGEVMDYQESQNQSLTEKFSYVIYDITYTTGANEDTRLWKMFYFQTDTHDYAFAYQMDADYAESMEEEYWDAVNSLELISVSYVQTGETEYDPSANGESLEDCIAFFDWWYQYGDLNAESICIFGDGTWVYYNALNEDGTGGYVFADGTFVASGTDVLQLYSADGSYVMDASLDEYGDLMLTPVDPDYDSIYADAAYIRASESVAYEAQPTGSDDDPSSNDDDPSVSGESLEDCIAFFDWWYQYGDLNAESICIFGDGTWVYYNALNEDGTGGYVFDEGTFVAAGTDVLQLYSADGSYVMDASLDEYGDLLLTPVDPDYGSFYADAAYIRASESVAYEAQTAE